MFADCVTVSNCLEFARENKWLMRGLALKLINSTCFFLTALFWHACQDESLQYLNHVSLYVIDVVKRLSFGGKA